MSTRPQGSARKLRIVSCLATIALGTIACTSMQPVVLTIEDKGRTIELVTDQDLVLNASHETGGVETWRFRATRPGVQVLRFEYVRSDDEPRDVVTYTVRVK